MKKNEYSYNASASVFSNDDRIFFKRLKVDFYRTLVKSNDKNRFYELFLSVAKIEKELEIGCENWKDEEFKLFFKTIPQYSEALKKKVLLDIYFKYLRNNELCDAYDFNNFNLRSLYNNATNCLLNSQFKELINKIINDYSNKNRIRDAAMLILVYYGVLFKDMGLCSTKNLDDYTYHIDNEYFIDILNQSADVFQYYTKNEISRKLVGNDIVCKNANISNDRYALYYSRQFDLIKEKYNDLLGDLTSKNIRVSGYLYCFCNEVLENGLPLLSDMLQFKSETGNLEVYEKYANKYDVTMLHIRNRYSDFIISQCIEIMKGRE